MNPIDLFIVLAIALAVILIIRNLVKKSKQGGGCPGCSGGCSCSNTANCETTQAGCTSSPKSSK